MSTRNRKLVRKNTMLRELKKNRKKIFELTDKTVAHALVTEVKGK